MTVPAEPDHGTPARPGPPAVRLHVDGTAVSVPAGTSVMRAASMAGIEIPRLCATDSLEPLGSCRLCLVEIEGRNGTPASCTTPCAPDMVVTTQSPRLLRLRRGLTELYASDHRADCLSADTDDDCNLGAIARTVGLGRVRYGASGRDHLDAAKDASNPYFTFDPAECIACSRCVRACDEVQASFALTMSGRGFDSGISASAGESFMDSECVSCGACVQACPTPALLEKTVISAGRPRSVVLTTCAYCGVGCSLRAELRDGQVVRMVPSKAGGANEGHSCVKGRFAWGYASHRDRQLAPMVRESITDPWQAVSWEAAISYAAARLTAIQAEHGVRSIGGITSSRCTNEEVFVVQKMIRAGFGNNNVDTCARVCHAPTGYGLSQTFGTSAGTQDFKSVDVADVILLIGANPTDGHPVFGSRLKQAVRKGAALLVIDPRRIDLVRSPHIEAAQHLQLNPGSNVALVNALGHVVVNESLVDRAFVAQRCEADSFQAWQEFIAHPVNSPEATEQITGVPAQQVRTAARAYANAPNGAIYYGLGVTEHSQGSTTVMAMANLAMATGNIGRAGVGINPLRGQNNVQGSCDLGSFPHELPGYRHVSDDRARKVFEDRWSATLDPEPGLRIPNMLDAAIAGTYRAMFIQGEDIAQSDPNVKHVKEALGSLDLLIVQDLFLNETAAFAHVFLPGTSFLEKDGTFTNAERRINRVRPVMEPRCGKQEWQVACELASAMGYPMSYEAGSQIMDEIAATTPAFGGVSFTKLDEVGSLQWPCNDSAPGGTPTMHVNGFVRGKGHFVDTPFVPTLERTSAKFPLILTTGRILSQYNVGAQTRRTPNVAWHSQDILEIHPHDAAERGIIEGAAVAITSRVGATVLRARVADRMPQGVVYTTFHYPASGANIVTTDNSDWATNCPEYKVTAVQVMPTSQVPAGQGSAHPAAAAALGLVPQ
jgi:formate dehydrogenase major subunit